MKLKRILLIGYDASAQMTISLDEYKADQLMAYPVPLELLNEDIERTFNELSPYYISADQALRIYRFFSNRNTFINTITYKR